MILRHVIRESGDKIDIFAKIGVYTCNNMSERISKVRTDFLILKNLKLRNSKLKGRSLHFWPNRREDPQKLVRKIMYCQNRPPNTSKSTNMQFHTQGLKLTFYFKTTCGPSISYHNNFYSQSQLPEI